MFKIISTFHPLKINVLLLNKCSKCLLLFSQTKMALVEVWLFGDFTLKSTPSVNCIWIITFFSHLHIWVTKSKPLIMLFQLAIVTSNNVAWMNFSTVLFGEAQHVVKTSTAGYVSICYDIINLFIEPQHFLLMFLNFKLKGFHLIVTLGKWCIFFFDG